MLSSGSKSVIVRLTFSLWLSVLIFALPPYLGWGATLLGFLIFPYYFEGPLLYFIQELAFSVNVDTWSPYIFWQTVISLLVLAIIIEARSLLFKFN